MDSELAEAIQAALKCKRAASLRLVASSCRPATSSNAQDVDLAGRAASVAGKRRSCGTPRTTPLAWQPSGAGPVHLAQCM